LEFSHQWREYELVLFLSLMAQRVGRRPLEIRFPINLSTFRWPSQGLGFADRRMTVVWTDKSVAELGVIAETLLTNPEGSATE
jgi:hypothetical protein